MVFLWCSYGFPMVFLWFSYGLPVNPTWLAGDSPKVPGDLRLGELPFFKVVLQKYQCFMVDITILFMGRMNNIYIIHILYILYIYYILYISYVYIYI